jgi:hypothetical protein
MTRDALFTMCTQAATAAADRQEGEKEGIAHARGCNDANDCSQ